MIEYLLFFNINWRVIGKFKFGLKNLKLMVWKLLIIGEIIRLLGKVYKIVIEKMSRDVIILDMELLRLFKLEVGIYWVDDLFLLLIY